MELSVDAYKRQLNMLRDKKSTIMQEIEQYQLTVKSLEDGARQSTT